MKSCSLQGGLVLHLVEQESGHHQASQDELLLVPGAEGRSSLQGQAEGLFRVKVKKVLKDNLKNQGSQIPNLG